MSGRPEPIAEDLVAVGRTVQAINDGQRGVIVEHPDGGLAVQLDRGNHASSQQVLVPFRRHQWSAGEEPRLQLAQVGRVSYDADRALLIARGEYGVPEWQMLREGDRIAWIRTGPPASDGQRRGLYASITQRLAPK